MQEYLAALPNGVDSHPDCTVKASVLRELVGSNLFSRVKSFVPKPVDAICASPPPVNTWINEVHLNVILAALLDHEFDGDEARFRAWIHEANRVLLGGPLYRAIFYFVGPRRLLDRAGDRWAQLRRGTTLAMLDHQRTSARLELRFPKNLLTGFVADMRVATFEDVLFVAGAKEGRVVLESLTEDRAVFAATWRV